MKVAIVNLGQIVSGNWRDPFAPGDTLLLEGSKERMHQLFERSTWHSAQHARQLIAVLERFGIEPDDPLTADDLAGLPLPERIWE